MVFGGRRLIGIAAGALLVGGGVLLTTSVGRGAPTTPLLGEPATERVSVSCIGTEANADSSWPSISADGRYVAFDSYAYTLAPGDTNGTDDVFVRDRVAGTTERVSVSSAGAQGNWHSYYGLSMSADGRYVAFASYASNLVPDDTPTCAGYYGTGNCWDIFVRDRALGTTERVSLATSGAGGNGDSLWLGISADGRYVAFESYASNLVPGDTNVCTDTWGVTHSCGDIFVRDRVSGTTERVSVSSSGAQANGDSLWLSISADGRYVAFQSYATNLVPSDTNGTDDVFVRDRVAGATERVSVATGGAQADGGSYNASISADGRYVAFESVASNLVPGDTNGGWDVFVRDRVAGATERVSVSSAGAQGWASLAPSISAGGRYVAFISWASNLVPGDTNTCYNYPSPGTCPDVFVRDRVSGTTERVSVSSSGAQADGGSEDTSISADGRYIAFASSASNLVPSDTNICGVPWTYGSCPDIFVHDRNTGATERVSVASDGTQGDYGSGDYGSGYLSISADGRYVAFDSLATNLVPSDTNGTYDIFVRDRGAAAPTPTPTPTPTRTPTPTPPPLPAGVVPVVLVHGICSNAADCWQASDGANFKAMLEGAGITPVITVELMPKPANGDIRGYAAQLQRAVVNIMTTTHATQVDIIGHSMGGLVARSYLHNYYRNGRSPVRKLIMLGTPNHGSELTLYTLILPIGLWAEMFRCEGQGTAGDQMFPCSAFLRELNYGSAWQLLCTPWRRWGTDILAPGVQHFTLAGTARLPDCGGCTSWVITGEDDGAVGVDSVHLDGVPGPTRYSRNHKQLNKDADIVTDVIHILRGEPTEHGTALAYAPVPLDAVTTTLGIGPTFSGAITAGQTVERHFVADASITNTLFLVSVETGTLSLTLRVPDGSVVDPAVAATDPNIEYLTDTLLPGTVGYTVGATQPGDWTLRFSASSLPTGGSAYQGVVLFDTTVGLTVDSDRGVYRPNESVVITAALAEGSTPITSAVVTGTVSRPDGATASLILYDNGSNGDASPNDGVYTAVYSQTAGAGAYDLVVVATGAWGGQPFARQQVGRFWVDASGQVIGDVRLQGRSDQRGAVMAVGPYEAGPDRFGIVIVTLVPAGSYAVTATMRGYLDATRTGAIVSTAMTTTLPAVTLLGGDANGDGAIDIYDLTLLGAGFGTAGPSDGRTDINGDGAVNVFDLVMVGANFGRSAPTPWP